MRLKRRSHRRMIGADEGAANMVDACRLGLCDIYATGGQSFGLIVGGAIGAVLIALLLRRRRKRRRDDN